MPDTPMYDYGYYSNYNNGGNTQGIGGQYPGNYGYYPQGQGQFGGGMSNPQYGSMANYFQSPDYQQYQQNYNTQNQGVYDQWVNYNRGQMGGQAGKDWQAPAYDQNRDYRNTGASSGFNPTPVVGNQWWGAQPSSSSYGDYGYGQSQGGNPIYPRNGNVQSDNTYAQTPSSNFNVNDWMSKLLQAYQGNSGGSGNGMPAALSTTSGLLQIRISRLPIKHLEHGTPAA